jgi:hypothetical protein
MNSVSRYALIALDPNQPDPPRTLAVGPLADATQLIPGSLALARARADAIEVAQELQGFTAEQQQHAARLRQIEDTLADVKATLQQIIDDFCDYFSAIKADREAERHRVAAEEASRAELRAALDALPDPDLDTSQGDYPAPNLEPSLPPPDYSEHRYDAAEDPNGPQMPGKPSPIPRDDTEQRDPDLPSGMGIAGIPGEGTMPKDIENLAHPQPYKQTPFAIGGS